MVLCASLRILLHNLGLIILQLKKHFGPTLESAETIRSMRKTWVIARKKSKAGYPQRGLLVQYLINPWISLSILNSGLSISRGSELGPSQSADSGSG
jgi:hypothetical protein